jgi:hypothetical protein
LAGAIGDGVDPIMVSDFFHQIFRMHDFFWVIAQERGR